MGVNTQHITAFKNKFLISIAYKSDHVCMLKEWMKNIKIATNKLNLQSASKWQLHDDSTC